VFPNGPKRILFIGFATRFLNNRGFPFTPHRRFSIPMGKVNTNLLSEIKEFCKKRAFTEGGIFFGKT
jgi:hypothetical protein